jgi:DNA-binding transcriptional LysR family regulator
MISPDLNELYYFVEIVRHKGFSAAARATGIEKTRLSRRIAALEKKLGVRLLQRSTRSISMTEAGERFYHRCLAAVEEAEAAYESIAALRAEPTGTVRMSCPLVLGQTYLAPVLPAYLAKYPKVNLIIEPTDREVDLIDERFDLALFARPYSTTSSGLVVKQLESARRILVASPAYLNSSGRILSPEALPDRATLGRLDDLRDGLVRWELVDRRGKGTVINHVPRLLTNDLRLQFETVISGIGIALLPEPIIANSIKSNLLEQVLPEWTAVPNLLYLAYPSPRGILPSVRSLLDHLAEQLPLVIQARSIIADTVLSGLVPTVQHIT